MAAAPYNTRTHELFSYRIYPEFGYIVGDPFCTRASPSIVAFAFRQLETAARSVVINAVRLFFVVRVYGPYCQNDIGHI